MTAAPKLAETHSRQSKRSDQPNIVDFEAKANVPHPRNQQAIRAALEKAGIAFIEENGGGAGLRSRDRQPQTRARATARTG